MLKYFSDIFNLKQNIFNEDDGATALEYGIIAAGIALAIIAVIFILGEDISFLFSTISEQVSKE